MGRIVFVGGLVCLALGLVATPANAGDDEGLRQEVEKLRQEVHVMRTSMLEKEIDSYLGEQQTWERAQGGDGLAGISIHARLTAVTQATVGLDESNRHAVNGDVDLDFDFQVTDNLDLFIYLTANHADDISVSEVDGLFNSSGSGGNAGAFPFEFGSGTHGVFPRGFGAIAGPTFAGLTDGIGVNGTVSVAPGSGAGAVSIYEAGIHHSVAMGDTRLHWELGKIDPRKRFHQNRFADDENTQFINNAFDDTSAWLWLSDASGRDYLGIHMWFTFGANDQLTLNWGFFNTPGQFFTQGQFMIQISWKRELRGRELNWRFFFGFDSFFQLSASEDDTFGFGSSVDWQASDTVGIFLRVANNSDDINPIETDISFGVVFTGVISSRPDDVLGIAFAFIQSNDDVIDFDEDSEFTIEVYYRLMYEDGKLQITPHLIFVSDPGGGEGEIFDDDSLFILGIRLHVPF